MRNFYGFGISRTMCEVFEEMRKCCKTGNYSYLPGLIEEAQSMGNRMESKLETYKDIKDAEDYIKKLKKEIKDLKEKKDENS